MIKSYHGTLFNPDLTKAKVVLYDYGEETKYEAETDGTELKFTGVKQWDIVSGEDAEDLAHEFKEPDILGEYLVLHFVDGTKKIYRNSNVAMFIW